MKCEFCPKQFSDLIEDLAVYTWHLIAEHPEKTTEIPEGYVTGGDYMRFIQQ